MELQTYRGRRESPAVSLPPLVLDRNEAARALRISTRKLDYLIKYRAIHPVRIDGRVLIAWVELLRFIDSKTVEGVSREASVSPGCVSHQINRLLQEPEPQFATANAEVVEVEP
jgi:hypothetical protein